MNHSALLLIVTWSLGKPVMLHARSFKDIVNGTVLPMLDAFVNFFMTISVLVLIAGVVRFMYTAGDDKSREQGRKLMLWGAFALFLMVSVWGVVAILKTTIFS